jgi:hypothetical protein
MTKVTNGYLAVAIDHRESFNRVLLESGGRLSRTMAKKLLTEAIQDSVDGLIVEWRQQPGWPLRWPRDIWWGAPDIRYQQAYHPGFVTAMLEPDTLSTSWLTGLKIGFIANGEDQWLRIIDETFRLAKALRNTNLRIIFEPYFSEEDNDDLRAVVIDQVTQCDIVKFTKLDVQNPSLQRTYSSASQTPWLARSDGVTYTRYVHYLERAIANKCGGCAAGKALWVDAFIADSPSPFNVQFITERVEQLRSVIGPNTEQL